jgi:hypothetical protein
VRGGVVWGSAVILKEVGEMKDHKIWEMFRCLSTMTKTEKNASDLPFANSQFMQTVQKYA